MLAATERIPKQHDGYQYYQLQYNFLSEAVRTGAISLWNPYLAHGSVVTWWYGFQASHFQNVLLLAGQIFPKLISVVSFVTWFHVSILFDNLLLILGLWKLSGILYRRPEAAFVVTAAGFLSAVGMEQFWFNFHQMYAVPMILYLLHAFIKDGARWRILAAANLLALQPLGNTIYMAPLIAFAVFVHFAVFLLLFPRQNFSVLRPKPADIFWLAAIAAGTLYVLPLLQLGAGEIHTASIGRNPDGSAPLGTFLTYGGNLSPVKFLDLLVASSLAYDFTMYCGAFTVAFAIMAVLFHPGKKTAHLVIVPGILVFFTMGVLGGIAYFAYPFFPMMKYFRHVALAAPLVRLWVILLAGVGADAFFDGRSLKASLQEGLAKAFVFIGIVLGLLSGLAKVWPGEVHVFLFKLMAGSLLPGHDSSSIVGGLTLTSVSFLTAGALLHLARLGPRWKPLAGLLILCFQAADLISYRTFQDYVRTVELTDDQAAAEDFGPLEYRVRRDGQAGDRSRRMESVTRGGKGVSYWTADAYFQVDRPTPNYLINFWMKPFDRLMQAFHQHETTGPPEFVEGLLNFTDSRPSYGRVIGLTEDKISVYRKAVSFSDPVMQDRAVTDTESGGRVLLIEGIPEEADTAPSQTDAQYKVEHFDEGSIRIRVTSSDGRWLLYRDVWHPAWKAWVNGVPVPVYRADLAYKAVPIQPGDQIVEFRFEIPGAHWLLRLLQINSMAWVLAVLIGIAVTLRKK